MRMEGRKAHFHSVDREDFTEKVIEINTWRSWDKSWISVEELSEHRADLKVVNMPTTFSDQKEAGVSESNGQREG